MPIYEAWDNQEKTILRVEFVDEWTWEDYQKSIDEMLMLSEDIEHYFVQLLDFRKSKPIPIGSAIPNVMTGRRKKHPHEGIVVIVGAEILVKIIVDVMERTSKKEYPKRYLVHTLEEAYQVIEEHFAERADVSQDP